MTETKGLLALADEVILAGEDAPNAFDEPNSLSDAIRWYDECGLDVSDDDTRDGHVYLLWQAAIWFVNQNDFYKATRTAAPALAQAYKEAVELMEAHFKKLWEDDRNVENVCGSTLAFCGRCEEDGGSILARAATWKDVPHSEKCIYAPARAFLKGE